MASFDSSSPMFEDDFLASGQQVENNSVNNSYTILSETYAYDNSCSNLSESYLAESYLQPTSDVNPDIMNWTGQDCVDFVLDVCYQYNIDPKMLDLMTLRNCRGVNLINFTQYEFCQTLHVTHDTPFYQAFRDLLQSRGIVPSSPTPSVPETMSPVPDSEFQPNDDSQLTDLSEMQLNLADFSDIPELDKILTCPDQYLGLSFGEFQDPVLGVPLDIKTETDTFNYSDSFMNDYQSNNNNNNSNIININNNIYIPNSCSNDVINYADGFSHTNGPRYSEPTSNLESNTTRYMDSTGYSECSSNSNDSYSWSDDLPHEVPGSPFSDPPSSPESPASPVAKDVLDKIPTTSRKRVRGPKNWEYLMRLLCEESYNPSVIRWEDKSAYTFRIVKSAVVAHIWGQRSGKPNLTYDNFARGLRYHYKTGALKAVSERQLVYRCGPKAIAYLRKEALSKNTR